MTSPNALRVVAGLVLLTACQSSSGTRPSNPPVSKEWAPSRAPIARNTIAPQVASKPRAIDWGPQTSSEPRQEQPKKLKPRSVMRELGFSLEDAWNPARVREAFEKVSSGARVRVIPAKNGAPLMRPAVMPASGEWLGPYHTLRCPYEAATLNSSRVLCGGPNINNLHFPEVQNLDRSGIRDRIVLPTMPIKGTVLRWRAARHSHSTDLVVTPAGLVHHVPSKRLEFASADGLDLESPAALSLTVEAVRRLSAREVLSPELATKLTAIRKDLRACNIRVSRPIQKRIDALHERRAVRHRREQVDRLLDLEAAKLKSTCGPVARRVVPLLRQGEAEYHAQLKSLHADVTGKSSTTASADQHRDTK